MIDGFLNSEIGIILCSVFTVIFIYIMACAFLYHETKKERKTEEYKKGYKDYPNDIIYKDCKYGYGNEVSLYIHGWEDAERDANDEKVKELIDKIIN